MAYRSKKMTCGCSLLAAFSILLFLCCQGKKKAVDPLSTDNMEESQKTNSVILEIENSSYSNSDFERHLRSLFGEDYHGLSFDSLSRMFDDFVDEQIYFHAAQMSEISLSVEEQKQYLAQLSRGPLPDEDLSSYKQEEVRALIARLRIEKYMSQQVKDIEVSEEEIKDYYDLHKREFLRPERIRVSQILLEKEDKAIAILEQVKMASEETFREIARKESSGVEAAKGGDMGLFEMGQLPFEMERMVFSLRVGEISPVVESTYGYHIFRLDARFEPELVSEESVFPEIRTKILNEKIKQHLKVHLADLKGELEWKSYPSNLSFPYQRMDYEEK